MDMKVGEDILTYGRNTNTTPTTGSNFVINLFDGLTRQNHKHYPWTTDDHHSLGVWCDILVSVRKSDKFSANLFGLPNTYTMRNSVRKFGFYRDEMFEKSGISTREMGKYQRTLRPRMFADGSLFGVVNSEFFQLSVAPLIKDGSGEVYEYSQYMNAEVGSDSLFLPEGFPSSGMQEELDYTDLVSVVQNIEVDSQGRDELSDRWDLHVIGDHRLEDVIAGKQRWTSVGMLTAYTEDRMREIPDATLDTSLEAPNNPLAALRIQAPSVGDIVELASEQEEEAVPYDQRPVGTMSNLVWKGQPVVADSQFSTFSGAATTKISNVFLPLGYLYWNTDAINFTFQITVKGIFECRDVD